MITLKFPRDAVLSTRWKLLAVGLGGTAGVLGAWLALTR